MNTRCATLKHYDGDHLTRIALPLGGIGTGSVSLGGRGGLRDWEIMNRPAKGSMPAGTGKDCWPSMVLSVANDTGSRVTRLMEGPLEHWEYEGHSGCTTANHGLPRFRSASFDGSYPFGRVNLSDPDVPLGVSIEGFNPLIPGDAERSGLPVAILRVTLKNGGGEDLDASVCVNVPNDIGLKGGDRRNTNEFRDHEDLRGIAMQPGTVDPSDEAWGTMALTTTATSGISHRTAWKRCGWGATLLDFWDEFSTTGELTNRPADNVPAPMGSLCVRQTVEAGTSTSIVFLLTWHFPNRRTWTPAKPDGEQACCGGDSCGDRDIIGNYYCTRFEDAWSAAEYVANSLESLEADTTRFVNAFLSSDLPDAVKEGALFNLSTLRTQTVFRTPDGRLYGWEGCGDNKGSCHGSCTHVWNYESSTAFLFGELAQTMREVEFLHSTGDDGLMSFRVHLPLERAQEFGRAAADGQMGCIMKCYREWQLSGDTDTLRALWPRVKAALAFCWIDGGWDGDRDGVMEGCQHNTMDVEYYGPNPQMQGWYLGALQAAAEMAEHLNDAEFAATCRERFANGSAWMDANLFNGEYYIHQERPMPDKAIAAGLKVGMTGEGGKPEYQLAEGCLVDQLVGQTMAHVTGLGYLHDQGHVKTTLRSILRYNRKEGFTDHFNCMRSYALGDETALLMAAYPGERPVNPFPYFTEVMTGFEWTAAVGMLYEGMTEGGLACIEAIRERYDGKRRNPYDEAECGHHYARAMAAWSAHLALTGFHYSAVEKTMTFAPKTGTHFWSTGYAWGLCTITETPAGLEAKLTTLHGQLPPGTDVSVAG